MGEAELGQAGGVIGAAGKGKRPSSLALTQQLQGQRPQLFLF